jgi:hypothetical protein
MSAPDMGRLKALGNKLIEMDRLGEEVERSLLEAQLQDIIDELNLHRLQLSIGGLIKETQYVGEERFFYKKGRVRKEDSEVFSDLHRFALDEVIEAFQHVYEILYSNIRGAVASAALSQEEKEGLRQRGWREVLVKKYLLTPDFSGDDEALKERYKDSYSAFYLLRKRDSGELFIFRFFVLGEWT